MYAGGAGEEEDMEALNQEDADGQPKKPAKVKNLSRKRNLKIKERDEMLKELK